jgi:hypothetical protein
VVSAEAVGTAFVEAAKELPAQGVQELPCRLGDKQFRGGLLAAPAAMVKKPAGLRTRPAWKQLDLLGGRWPLRLGPAVCSGVRGCQVWRPCLEAAHGDDLLSLPYLEGESVGSPAEDGVGAIVERVEKGDHATMQPRARWAVGDSNCAWQIGRYFLLAVLTTVAAVKSRLILLSHICLVA